MSPVKTIVIATEVITDELWMIAVITAPINTRRMGFVMAERKFLTASSSAKDSIDPLIIERPTNNMPKPARMPPTFLTVLAQAAVGAVTYAVLLTLCHDPVWAVWRNLRKGGDGE